MDCETGRIDAFLSIALMRASFLSSLSILKRNVFHERVERVARRENFATYLLPHGFYSNYPVRRSWGKKKLREPGKR